MKILNPLFKMSPVVPLYVMRSLSNKALVKPAFFWSTLHAERVQAALAIVATGP